MDSSVVDPIDLSLDVAFGSSVGVAFGSVVVAAFGSVVGVLFGSVAAGNVLVCYMFHKYLYIFLY